MYGSKSFMKYKKKELAPDLTPLIDVVFLLLIFFMVATTFNNRSGIKLDLPQSSVEEISGNKINKIELYMGKESELKLVIKKSGLSEEIPITRESLEENIKSKIADISEKRVALLADREIPHGEIVEMMSLLKEAGVEILDIEAEKEN